MTVKVYAVIQGHPNELSLVAVENERVKVVSAALRVAHYRNIRGPLRIGGVEPKHADSVLFGDTYHVCWFGTFTPEFCS